MGGREGREKEGMVLVIGKFKSNWVDIPCCTVSPA